MYRYQYRRSSTPRRLVVFHSPVTPHKNSLPHSLDVLHLRHPPRSCHSYIPSAQNSHRAFWETLSGLPGQPEDQAMLYSSKLYGNPQTKQRLSRLCEQLGHATLYSYDKLSNPQLHYRIMSHGLEGKAKSVNSHSSSAIWPYRFDVLQ